MRLLLLLVHLLLAACSPNTRECRSDSDCDDANPCTGVERCASWTCETTSVPQCAGDDTCFVRSATAVCDVLCPLPPLPALQRLAEGDVLPLGEQVEVAVDDGGFAVTKALSVPEGITSLRVRARFEGMDCVRERIYEVAEAYPGAAGGPDSVAVPASAAAAWAHEVVDVVWGEGVAESWQDPSFAVGVAEGNAEDVVPLGRGGWLTVRFDPPLHNGHGPDLAVFENSFTDDFLELGFVEVSSDGTTFARFDAASRTPKPLDAFGTIDPTDVSGLAGDVRQGFGTPFDLGVLHDHDLVRTGQLDLDRVAFVRVVDVVGDGSDVDALGRPIYDPYPTAVTAGFDLDAIAALEER